MPASPSAFPVLALRARTCTRPTLNLLPLPSPAPHRLPPSRPPPPGPLPGPRQELISEVRREAATDGGSLRRELQRTLADMQQRFGEQAAEMKAREANIAKLRCVYLCVFVCLRVCV